MTLESSPSDVRCKKCGSVLTQQRYCWNEKCVYHNQPQQIGRSRAKTWDVYWSPEGRKIATVEAITARAAMRKAPYPYRKYLGEMYAVES